MAKEYSGKGRGGVQGRGGRGRGGHRGGGQDGSRPDKSGQRLAVAVPANWPSRITYLSTPIYSGISPQQRKLLQTQPGDGGGVSRATPPLSEVPPILRFGPNASVEIKSISDPAHPACGQHGLFAARNLAAGSFILPYLGVYHRGHVRVSAKGSSSSVTQESDYDLWLDRAADVAVDAAWAGNEARFVNDYRGTGKPRPNAEFREVWDARRGERGMAVFVLPAPKRKLGVASRGGIGSGATGISKGEEILVSYGKGFWEMRQKESQEKEQEQKENPVSAAASTEGIPQDGHTEQQVTVDSVADKLGAAVLHAANGPPAR